jgi:PAS domain S-box-containing protein
MNSQGHTQSIRATPLCRIKERITGLFAPRDAVSEDGALTARLIRGVLLVSLPILLVAIAIHWALGKGLTGTENLTLTALTVVGLLAALFLRCAHVNVSGFVLTFALWAGGTFITWMDFGFQDIAAMLPLLSVLIAFLVLPWIAGILTTLLSISSIWLRTALELHGLRTPGSPNPVDMGFTLTAIYILVSLVALVCGQILRHAVRQTIATQQALSRSANELSSILQRTPDIIYRLDSEGRITFVNEAVRRYGYDPLKMIGTRLLDYVHPEDRTLAGHRVDERRAGDRSTRTLEIRLLTSWGSERVAEYTAVPVQHVPVFLLQAEGLYESGTGSQHYIGTQGIARDITDRKLAEQALKKSEEKYTKVFRAAPAGVAVASLNEARFLDVNEEFERIYGFSRDELIGRSAFDIGLWFDAAEREQIMALLGKGEPVKELEVQARTKNGDIRTVRFNGQLIDIGGIACLITAVVDITDRKRLESQLQQSQKLEAVGRLAGGIAHDFNNMLAVILGQADLASQTLPPGNPAHESIQEIRKAAERSAELTRQLLVFARRQDAAPRALDLNWAISERMAMLRRLIGESVALNWNPAPSLWSVKMDPTQVDQILINLAVNARDAIADVGTLTISTENRLQEEAPSQHAEGDGPREWVILTVQDTGTGMGNESLAHIFEPFFTTKEIGKGTGMGLATVYGIVQHSGGRIEVESELGKGTTFRVYLPRTLEVAINVREAEQTELARGHETLLVVEDEPANLKIIRITLQQLGYSVMEAASAKDALAVATQHEGPLHLLLTDMVMPEMSGHDLHTRIATYHRGVKAIYMSGYFPDAIPRSDDGKGDVPFLQKPFGMRQLSARVREVLDADQDVSSVRNGGEQAG